MPTNDEPRAVAVSDIPQALSDNDTVAAPALPEIAAPDNSTPATFAVRGFQKGFDPRRNTLGRIKKKPTVIDELAKQAHQARHRRRIASAWVEAAETAQSAVGQRAREALSDRLYGLPKATLVIEQGEAPADALLAELHAMLSAGNGPTGSAGSPPHTTVDGEARLLP